MILPCEQFNPEGKSLEELRNIQLKIASNVALSDHIGTLKTVAGADCSYIEDRIIAVIVVTDISSLEVLEQKYIVQPVKMPYISTYLSFREGYPLCCVFQELRIKPDLMLVDGCGISHPRGAGIATHLGVVLNVPTIGISKKVLCGKSVAPIKQGEANPLIHESKHIGWLLKSTKTSKPIIVTPGHYISVKSALSMTKMFLKGYKLPEPIRLADNFAYMIRSQLRSKVK
ncbi:MAG: endonuclease V [Methanomethylovorans sp.]|jgi:deoxyribonuclease V|nr:endonuclease V [Methanomethylovorans sp.]